MKESNYEPNVLYFYASFEVLKWWVSKPRENNNQCAKCNSNSSSLIDVHSLTWSRTEHHMRARAWMKARAVAPIAKFRSNLQRRQH